MPRREETGRDVPAHGYYGPPLKDWSDVPPVSEAEAERRTVDSNGKEYDPLAEIPYVRKMVKQEKAWLRERWSELPPGPRDAAWHYLKDLCENAEHFTYYLEHKAQKLIPETREGKREKTKAQFPRMNPAG